jgi:hypothetical protein
VGEEDRVTAAQRLEVAPLQLRVDHRSQVAVGVAREAALARVDESLHRGLAPAWLGAEFI